MRALACIMRASSQLVVAVDGVAQKHAVPATPSKYQVPDGPADGTVLSKSTEAHIRQPRFFSTLSPSHISAALEASITARHTTT